MWATLKLGIPNESGKSFGSKLQNSSRAFCKLLPQESPKYERTSSARAKTARRPPLSWTLRVPMPWLSSPWYTASGLEPTIQTWLNCLAAVSSIWSLPESLRTSWRILSPFLISLSPQHSGTCCLMAASTATDNPSSGGSSKMILSNGSGGKKKLSMSRMSLSRSMEE